MAEARKNSIVVICALVGCVVTLLTCGTLIGNIQANDQNQTKQLKEISKQVEATKSDVSAIKEEQAFQKGVVTTQLTTQGAAIVRIEKKLDDLVRVP